MNGRAVTALAVGLLVVLAGCGGGAAPGTTTPTTATTTTDAGGGGDDGGGGGSDARRTGTVAFYVSDRPGAIGDFRSLNVTVTKVGLHRANATGSGSSDGEANGSALVVVNAANTTTAMATATAQNGTTTAQDGTATRTETTTTSDDEKAGDGYRGESWILADVDDTTVDLTELQGENATLLGDLRVPAGDYDTVFIYVTDAGGTLQSGEHVNVKVPSRKLKVHSNFTVAPDETVTFVYDLMVHEAGKSGKYVLRPVVSQTGAGKDVKPVSTGGDRTGGERRPGDASEAQSGNATATTARNETTATTTTTASG